MASIKKAVFPVGGLGTRFLPITKAMPKEMLPIIDKPLIQYAVDEARAAGIEEFIFVTGRGKSAIEDYFDLSYELNDTLRSKAKNGVLEQLNEICLDPGQISYTRQQQPLGLGHAVWCARHLVGDEPFAVLLADDFILAKTPCLEQLVSAHGKTGGSILAVMDVPRDQTGNYGILDPGDADGDCIEVRGLIEKPKADAAPSTKAVIGRYILSPEVFGKLAEQETGAGGEVQLTDAIAELIGEKPVHGYSFEGQRFDCGNKAGFLEATLAVARTHPELAHDFRRIVDDA